jgi:lipopolysaccharide/colanic/teichoic acid biosynthesis glycosyltransferase
MRYKSPIAIPFSQYWEEQLILDGGSRFWKNLYANISYIYAEYFLSNFILVISLVAKALSPKPVIQSISTIYHVYGLKWALKRTIDVVGAIVGIILATPFFIVIPILIKFNSHGPVFYRQERIGKNRRRQGRRSQIQTAVAERRASDRRQKQSFGQPFVMAKFRTMYQDAEQQTGPVWASRKDPRITRIGAVLRVTRIDEIPQLFNVLKGDMSLVGPRPERAFFIEKLKTSINGYEKRLLVKPGLTGLAQVEHKYDESEDDVKAKVKYDLTYIYNFRLVNDVKIMLKTIYVVLAAKGM